MKFSKIFSVLILAFIVAASANAQRPNGLKRLRVVTEPNAVISINGMLFGNTDENGELTILVSPTVKKTIKVKADGFKTVSRLLTAAERTEAKIKLTPTENEADLAYQEGERQAVLDRQKAIAAYKKAIELNPKYIDAMIGLLRQYSETAKYDEAAQTIAMIRRVDPRNDVASAVEGRLFKDVGKIEDAVKSFKRSVTEGGGVQAEANTGLGLLYKELAEQADDQEAEEANYALAIKHFTLAIDQLQGSADAPVIYQLLGLIYEQRKQNKEAIALYELFLENFPNSDDATAVRSFIVQLKKQADQP